MIGNMYEIEDLEEFIDRVCSSGAVPENDILTQEAEQLAEKKANISDEAVRDFIMKCVGK